MNTNAKHYEILAIEPWEIMDRNFPPEEFVAYLKGNIIKYTLRDKGQALTDAEKIKHYAEKLIEVLEKKDMDEFLDGDTERIYEYGEAEPVEETEDEHKFKIGDRVVLYKGDKDEREGKIIRLPMKNSAIPTKYIIELDKKGLGWNALRSIYGVNSDNAWSASEYSLTLLEDKPKKTLEPYKWYDASVYTVEELKELLPVGTKVIVTRAEDNDREVDLETEKTQEEIVKRVDKRWIAEDTRIAVEGCCFYRRYFKIIE